MKQTATLPKVHWVLHLSDRDSVLKLQPESEERYVPDEGEVVTRPFLVDSVTKKPVPVRIVQRLVDEPLIDTPSFVVVVARSATREQVVAAPSEH
jgi:hypothetical protein